MRFLRAMKVGEDGMGGAFIEMMWRGDGPDGQDYRERLTFALSDPRFARARTLYRAAHESGELLPDAF